MHFSHQHPWNRIIILEEENQPHPWCPQCDIFSPQEALNRAYPTPSMCQCETYRKRRRLVVEETEEQMGRVFLAYGTMPTEVSSFRYLGRTLLSFDYNWSAVERNLQRARVKWGRLEMISVREGLDRRTARRFYVAVVQEVLLFDSEPWVLPPPDWRKPLMGFTTGRRGGWRAREPNINRMGHGCTHPLGRHWQ